MRYPKRPGSSIGDEMAENGDIRRTSLYLLSESSNVSYIAKFAFASS